MAEVSIARLERALELTAIAVAEDGDVALPLFERLEAELAAARTVQDARAATVERARRIAADARAREGGRCRARR
mgnify:CR=1 FL=1